MSNSENPTPTQDNSTTPPPKRFAKRNQMLWLAVYFVFVGILLLQNVYNFWPETKEIDTDRTLLLQINDRKIDSLSRELNVSGNDSLRPQLAKSIRRLDSIQYKLLFQEEDAKKDRNLSVKVLFWTCKTFPADKDQSLLLLVLIMGAIGSWLHAVSSFLDFVGNRNFVASWITWYLMRPILGSMMAVVFYVVIRAGLFPQGGIGFDAINPFSIAALAGLVGLFTQRASKKLADVFDALFPTIQKNKDPLEAKHLSETITQLTPAQFEVGAKDLKVQVSGSNFTEKSTAFVNGKKRPTTFKDKGNLEFTLDSDDVATAGTLDIIICDPDLGLDTGGNFKLPVETPAG